MFFNEFPAAAQGASVFEYLRFCYIWRMHCLGGTEESASKPGLNLALLARIKVEWTPSQPIAPISARFNFGKWHCSIGQLIFGTRKNVTCSF